MSGFGIQGGAIASSVSHDSHNIIVIGDNDEDMYLAVQELIRTQGGYTLVADHHVYDTLELPVMGLMSDAGFQYSHRKLERMIRKAHEMGVPDAMAPFITLSFMLCRSFQRYALLHGESIMCAAVSFIRIKDR